MFGYTMCSQLVPGFTKNRGVQLVFLIVLVFDQAQVAVHQTELPISGHIFDERRFNIKRCRFVETFAADQMHSSQTSFLGMLEMSAQACQRIGCFTDVGAACSSIT